jgi:hypothetical protein
MALRFVRQVWSDWQGAVRDLASTVSSMLMDEDKPSRWDDLTFPAQSIDPAGLAQPPTWDSAEAALSFSPTAINVIQGHAQMTHTYAEGTSVSPHLHVYFAGTASPGTQVVWLFRYKWYNINTTVPAWTEVSINAAVSAQARVSHIVSLGQIPGTGKLISSLFAWEVSRVGNAAGDTYSSAVILSQFDIHIQKARNRGTPRITGSGYG